MSTICQVYSLYAGELWLGRRDEGGMRSVAIDVSPWLADLVSGGTFMLAVSRPGEDNSPYNPAIVFDGQKIIWTPNDVDTAKAGTGTAELRYYVGTDKIKSKAFKTIVASAPYTLMDPPSAIEPFVERMEQAAANATAASASAAISAATATEQADTATTKASEASTSASQADASADAAAASATSAAGSATAAAQSATAASNAADDATESEQIAAAAANAATAASGTATTKAAEAAQSAATATNQAAAAAQSATSASSSAGDAEQAAETATTKASEASTSASQADASADAASASATSAAGSATAAAQSATAASNAQTVAEAARAAAQAARTGAEAAQTGAETAQGAAESAAASVSASAAQIATNTADITALKADLLHKADINGYYEDLSAGTADQLVSTVYEEDSVPYIFRTAGGSMDIGDREEDMLVGGTVAWNQLVANGDFADGATYWTTRYSTLAVSNGIATFAPTSDGTSRGIVQANNRNPVLANHKYLISADINPSADTVFSLSMAGASDKMTGLLPSNTWTKTGAIWTYDNPTFNCNVSIFSYGTMTTDQSAQVKNVFSVDLTQMFGSTIADYIYGLEHANAGAGVAWFRKLFPNMDAEYSYHEDSFDAESPLITKKLRDYQPGILLSVGGLSSHTMVGFNLFDKTIQRTNGTYLNNNGGFILNQPWCVTDYIPIVGGQTYYLNCVLGYAPAFCWYDSSKAFISGIAGGHVGASKLITAPQNAHFLRASLQIADIDTVCINLSWDGERNGEYEPYVKRSYPLDSSVILRGIPKLDSNNRLYYDGDTYESDGTVTRRYGVVDLGSLTWSMTSAGRFYTQSINTLVKKSYAQIGYSHIRCVLYVAQNVASLSGLSDKSMSVDSGGNIQIRDDAYTSTASFKTAMSGVMLVYELATPTTETADPFQNPQIVDDFGTEEYVTTSIVPVGHVTKYQPNLRAKLEMSPDSPDGDGDYIVRQANGENSYIALASTATIQDILARLTALEGNTNEG